MPFPLVPVIGGAIAAGNAINSAVQGGKQNEISEEALAVARAREADAQQLRDMFMQRTVSGATPEQSVFKSESKAADIFGAGDKYAAGRGNPFANPMAGPEGELPPGMEAAERRPASFFGGPKTTEEVEQSLNEHAAANPERAGPLGIYAMQRQQTGTQRTNPALQLDDETLANVQGIADRGNGPWSTIAKSVAGNQVPQPPLDVAAAASPPPERDARSTGSWLNRILGGNR